jgi:glycine betaine/choline ABC-type transport system substrate-binding protein
LLLGGCSRAPKAAFIVGAKPGTEPAIVAEAAAQHLEKRLGAPVTRKFDVATTTMAYQGLLMTDVDIFPEDTTAIVSAVLKERVDPNPAVVFERAKSELMRLARIEVLPPLGIRHRYAMVVSAAKAAERRLETLSEACRSEPGWTLAVTAEFQDRPDGFGALMGKYNLPLRVAARTVDPRKLYSTLSEKQADMIAGFDTDGALESPEVAALADDRKAFEETRTCLLVRQEALQKFPAARAALEELSGKFSNDRIRKLNYQVDVRGRPVKDVAAEFLREAGL